MHRTMLVLPSVVFEDCLPSLLLTTRVTHRADLGLQLPHRVGEPPVLGEQAIVVPLERRHLRLEAAKVRLLLLNLVPLPVLEPRNESLLVLIERRGVPRVELRRGGKKGELNVSAA